MSQCVWPPFCLTKFTICCWSVRCNATMNLSHWSCDTNRSSTASLLLYAALRSLRISSYCLRVSTSRLRSWSNNPKSGSMMSASSDFSLLMLDKMCESTMGPRVGGVLEKYSSYFRFLEAFSKYSTPCTRRDSAVQDAFSPIASHIASAPANKYQSINQSLIFSGLNNN